MIMFKHQAFTLDLDLRLTFRGDYWFSYPSSASFDSLRSELIFFKGELLFLLYGPAAAVFNEDWDFSGLQNEGLPSDKTFYDLTVVVIAEKVVFEPSVVVCCTMPLSPNLLNMSAF